MCGIFGWSLKAGAATEDMMLALATVLGAYNDRRGGDGWGVWTPEVKRPVKGIGVFHESGAAELMASSLRAIGHTRKACSGAVVPHNSHPFRRRANDGTRTVVGCHNGMVFNHAEVADALGITYEVDSEVLVQMLADRQRDELASGLVEGYGVLCWTVEGHDAICLCKMRQGQLAVMGLGDRDAPWGVVWSSDQEHLERALKVAHLYDVSFPYRIEEGEVVRAKDGTLYSSTMRIELSGRRVTQQDARATGLLLCDDE